MTEHRDYVEPTTALADFAANLEAPEIPGHVADSVKRLLLDALAAAFAGWTSVQSEQVAKGIEQILGPGACTVVGRTPMSPGAATVVNGYLITARSFCDIHQPTLAHITPVVVPPLLAGAEMAEGISGARLLAALTVAMESMIRVGQGLIYPVFRGRGWHTPGVAGPVGGALGLASLHGFTPDEAERAAGIGVSQAAGTFGSFGTPTIKLHQARAGWSALMAAEVVRQGFEGPLSMLTKQDGGLFNTHSNGGDPIAVTDGLGEVWELEQITTRLWPTAAALQSVVAMILVDRPDVPEAADIRSVVVGLPPANYEMNAEMTWETPFRAVLSARYVTAVALEERRCTLDQFRQDRLDDAPALVDRIRVEEDPTLPEGGAWIRIETAAGDVTLRRQTPKGSPADPATWPEVVGKLRSTATGTIPDTQIDGLVRAVESLEDLDDARSLTALLTP